MNKLFNNNLTGVIWVEGQQVSYDELGVIVAIFLFNSFTDDYVKVDTEYYERRHPSRFNYLQEKVNEQIAYDKLMKEMESVNE